MVLGTDVNRTCLQRVTSKNSTLKWKQENLLFNPNDKSVKLPHDILITSLPWRELKIRAGYQGSFCRTLYARPNSNLSICPTVVSLFLSHSGCSMNVCTSYKKTWFPTGFIYIQILKHCLEISPTYVLRESLHFLGHVVPWWGTSVSLLGRWESSLMGDFRENRACLLQPFWRFFSFRSPSLLERSINFLICAGY